MNMVLDSKYFWILLILVIFYLLYTYKECKKLRIIKAVRIAQVNAIQNVFDTYTTTIPNEVVFSVVNAIRDVANDNNDDDEENAIELNIGKKDGEENENS